MRSSPDKADELELDLPALDGEDDPTEAERPEAAIDLELHADGGDALDDRTGEDAPHDDLAVEGTEGGWLVDADESTSLDVGVFDVSIQPEGKVLEDDEADTRAPYADDLVGGDEVHVADGGEEGPLDDDEELREEDLPALDADDDGDVPDDALYERGMIVVEEDLRWDDRAWARAGETPADETARDDDSGILATPGDDPAQSARDATWKKLDETGRIMAATFMPGGSAVVALATSDRTRAMIVRISTDGEARIIAEVDPRATRTEDDEDCKVTFLRWDAAQGCLFVGGSFGVEAYRPAGA